MRRALAATTLPVVLLALAPAAPGTTYVRELGARDLGESAVAVVRGEVGDVRSFWNERRTKIFTEIVVRTQQTFKGSPGAAVTLLQLGGVVDDVRVTVHGALSWRVGEEVLLFLEPAGRGRYQVAGFSQGKLPIERDPATGEAFVRRPSLAAAEASGLKLLDGPGAPPDAGTPARVPLEKFVREALGDRPAIENR